MKEKTTFHRGGYPDESDSDSHSNRARENRRHPGRRRYYQERSRRPPKRDSNQDGNYPGSRGPPDSGGPLMMEDHQEMEGHQEDQEDKDHPAHQDLLDQYTL